MPAVWIAGFTDPAGNSIGLWMPGKKVAAPKRKSAAKYWHVDKAGRDPLRIVRTPLFPDEPITMFGSPAVWIDEADAKKGSAFFTLTKVVATKTKTTVSFAYPIEGIVGTAVFAHSPGDREWRLETATIGER